MLGGTQRQGQWVSAAHAGRKMFNLKFKGNDFPANCGSHWISGKALGPDGLWCWGAQNSELSIGLGHGSTLRSQVFFFKTCYVQDDVYVVWRIVQGRWLIVEPSQMCVCSCIVYMCMFAYVHMLACVHMEDNGQLQLSFYIPCYLSESGSLTNMEITQRAWPVSHYHLPFSAPKCQ